MGSFVIESTVRERFIQEGLAAVGVVNCGAPWIPPVGLKQDVSEGAAEQGVAAAEQVESGVKLGHAALVLGLDERKVVYPRSADTAHSLHPFERPEPVQREKSLVWADAEYASAAELGKVQRVVGCKSRVAMTRAYESDLANRILVQVLMKTPVQREERRRHRLHEQPLVRAGSGKYLLKLAHVEGRRLFAKHVFAGGKCRDAKLSVGVRMRCDLDGIDIGCKERIEGGGYEDPFNQSLTDAPVFCPVEVVSEFAGTT